MSAQSISPLKAPFPYFGGKSRIADVVWSRFGQVTNYVEPFFGSGAILLNRPFPFDGVETVNDMDGMIANFWRAVSHDPEQTARYADWPVNENDLHARHIWLVNQRETLTRRLEGDPEYFDAQIAGYWVWGISCWIGGGFCSGNGPWQLIEDEEGCRRLVHLGNNGQGVSRQLVHLGNKGQGVNRKRVHLGDNGQGVNRQLVHLGNTGQGVNRQLVHLGNKGRGVNRKLVELTEYFSALAERLRDVRVCCGDCSRVLGPTVTYKHGLTAVFLDPPYSNNERADGLYTEDCGSVATKAREWAIENGNHKLLRIALCGYEGEHNMPEAWECMEWLGASGYEGQNRDKDNQNRKRERIWFSPNCLKAQQAKLF